MNWILFRAKAFVAAVIAGLIPVVIKAAETSFMFDLPASFEQAIIAALAFGAVHQTANRSRG